MTAQRFDLSQAIMRSRVTHVSQEVRHGSGYSLPAHRHPDIWQADWVLDGQLTYVIGDQVSEIGPGEIGFIPPSVRHKLISRDGFVIRAIKFELPFEFLRERPTPTIVRAAAGAPLLNALADEIFVYRRSLPWTMNIGYLGALFRLVESPEAPEEPTDFRTAENPVARAKQFALAHLGEPLTVQRLAAEAHLSPAHFTRLFRAHTGKSPIEWLAEKRLLQATQLLRYADMSLSDIAEQVGYADLPTFSKAFKRWLGMSPSIYRSKAGEVSVGKHWNDTLYT